VKTSWRERDWPESTAEQRQRNGFKFHYTSIQCFRDPFRLSAPDVTKRLGWFTGCAVQFVQWDHWHACTRPEKKKRHLCCCILYMVIIRVRGSSVYTVPWLAVKMNQALHRIFLYTETFVSGLNTIGILNSPDSPHVQSLAQRQSS
jgi:hypothetical protein